MNSYKIVNHKIVNGVSTEWKGQHIRFQSNPGPKKKLSNDHLNFDKEKKLTQNEICMSFKIQPSEKFSSPTVGGKMNLPPEYKYFNKIVSYNETGKPNGRSGGAKFSKNINEFKDYLEKFLDEKDYEYFQPKWVRNSRKTKWVENNGIKSKKQDRGILFFQYRLPIKSCLKKDEKEENFEILYMATGEDQFNKGIITSVKVCLYNSKSSSIYLRTIQNIKNIQFLEALNSCEGVWKQKSISSQMSNWGICKSELGVYGWDFWEKLQEKINAKVIEIQKEDEIIHITVGKKRKEKTK